MVVRVLLFKNISTASPGTRRNSSALLVTRPKMWEGGGGDPQVVAADELALRHECAADFAAVPFLLKCVTEFTGACV